MFCDLHTHSTFSDGTFSPTEIVLKAKEIGLDAVALCDHNLTNLFRQVKSTA
jgi:predicted metal-dependent phosphoesterase TrpH